MAICKNQVQLSSKSQCAALWFIHLFLMIGNIGKAVQHELGFNISDAPSESLEADAVLPRTDEFVWGFLQTKLSVVLFSSIPLCIHCQLQGRSLVCEDKSAISLPAKTSQASNLARNVSFSSVG